MLNNIGTRLGFGFATLAMLMALTIAGNSAATSHRHAAQGSTASQVSAGYLERLGATISAEFFV